MKTKDLMPGQSFDSLRLRRELLDVKAALEASQRKLFKTESALESLAGFLTVLPDPIEIVSSDLTILFANETSKKLHHNPHLEGKRYDEIVNLGEPSEDGPISVAVRENREVVFSAVYEGGDVYETTVAPATLSDGRRAALCLSKPVVLARAKPDGAGEPRPMRIGVSAAPGSLEETELLRRIATLSTRTLDAVLDNVTDAVVVAGDSGDVVLVNRAFCDVTGFKADGVIPLAEVLFPDRDHSSPFAEIAAGLGRERFETTIEDSGGNRIPVEMTAAVLPGDDVNPQCHLFAFRDLRVINEVKDRLQSNPSPPGGDGEVP